MEEGTTDGRSLGKRMGEWALHSSMLTTASFELRWGLYNCCLPFKSQYESCKSIPASVIAESKSLIKGIYLALARINPSKKLSLQNGLQSGRSKNNPPIRRYSCRFGNGQA
jgi:hypothetical protein